MSTLKFLRMRTGLVLLLLAGLLISPALVDATRVQAAAAPLTQRAAGVPASTCTLNGSVRTCELWATTGTIPVAGTILPIWGYSTTNTPGSATLPGPVLVGNQNETLEVILHNALSEATSMNFPGSALAPDTVGAAAGGDVTYTFSLKDPGTFLYEAGLTDNGGLQVAMGMFGALVVRPASNTNWAYDRADTAFDAEELMVLSEIDPDLNNNPGGFDMRYYKPRYWLVNGQTFPDAGSVLVDKGNAVLLRYLNGGLLDHSIGVLGLNQTVMATDGNLLAYPYRVNSETIVAGQSLDVMLSVPAAAPDGAKYPVYDAGFHIHNNGQTSSNGQVTLGGMFTYLMVPDAAPASDLIGPVSIADVAPSLTNGLSDATLTGTVSDVDSGNANVTDVEYFFDNLGADGTGTAVTGFVAAPLVSINEVISAATLSSLPHGEHVIYVHGKDANGNWGAVTSAVIDLVSNGPVTYGMSLSANPVNGTKDVNLSATVDASSVGSVNVDSAEYFIDSVGSNGSGTAMALNNAAHIVNATVTVSAATIGGLPEGTHTFYVHGRDAFGNWGGIASISLRVDKTGPFTGNLQIAPNPNNGQMPLSPNISSVRVDARFGDPATGWDNLFSNIADAEAFIDVVQANGSGSKMTARDAVFNTPVEDAYFYIPLTTVSALSGGVHTVYVHAKDAAGNWGPMSTIDLVVIKDGPAVNNLAISPTPTNGATPVSLTAVAVEPANGSAQAIDVAAAEYFIDNDPGLGNGYAVAAADGAFDNATEALSATIDVSGIPNGVHLVYVRAKDAMGNWGPAASFALDVENIALNGLLFVNGFETGNFFGWAGATGNANVVGTARMGPAGAFGMQASLSNTPAFVTDLTPSAETIYHAGFFFNPNGSNTAGNVVDLFIGENLAGDGLFGIRYEMADGNNGYEVQAWVKKSDGQVLETAWYHINNAANKLELKWGSSAKGQFTFFIDDKSAEQLQNVDTSGLKLETVKLGPSGVLASGMSGELYFDEFFSARGTSQTAVGKVIFLPMISNSN